ncbi:MAG TPA: acyltransferase domain-containing protein, partial [Archangium sp.]
KTPALSPTGDCKPFSETADGTLLGEGIAMVAMKRLEDAERDGDRIYAVLKGLGSASDGRANSVYAPLPEGQARSLRRAYEAAGYGPETVELVEAHGTGTKAGDAAEFAGLKLAFGNPREPQWCALGTVKSQIGHTKAAAGAAGLFKAVMALHHKVLPPTIKIDKPNPKLEIEKSPFYLNTTRRPWIRDAAHPRRASVSSFGFGGSNFHVTLEEYIPAGNGKQAWKLRAMPTELVLLGAANAGELVSKAKALVASKQDLVEAARATQLSFKVSDTVRLAIVAASTEELAEKLNAAIATIEKAPGTAYSTPNGTHYVTGAADAGQVAFLFPGQGSQYVGMGAEVAMAFDEARLAWDRASNVSFGAERLHDVVFPKPVFTDADRDAQQKKLTQTEWAQPALGVHSQSLANVLHTLGLKPNAVAGHSFGEVMALHEAGALDAEALVKVARKRGELMRDAAASTQGAMTAVAKPIDEVKAAVAASGANVVVANHNSPNQVVLSGSVQEIEKVEAALSAKGMTAKRLPVATAFHSPLVAGSSVPFKAFLDGVAVKSPSLDVFANATAAAYPKEAGAIREQLASQLA